MRITTQGEYGLRCMIHIAKNSRSGPVSIQSISSSEDLPKTYVEQLLLKLRRHGLIKSVRGAHGGYLLAQMMNKITVRQMIDALEGTVFEIVCDRRSKSKNPCQHDSKCALNSVWIKMQNQIIELLDHITLEDLLKEER